MNEIAQRRSIRKYADCNVKIEDIETIIQAAILAPSAKNRQPWKYFVYTGAEKDNLLDIMEQGLIRERDGEKILPNSQKGLADAFHTLKVIRTAPVLIVIENKNGRTPFMEIVADDRITEICDSLSIGASVQNMLLTATELGYGTLWTANTCFAYNELAEYIGITGQLVGAVSLGVPAEQPNPRPRKNINDVVEYR